MEVAEGGMSLSQRKGSYGGNLMPGEGDAMAQYVQSGERTLAEYEWVCVWHNAQQICDKGFMEGMNGCNLSIWVQ